MTLDDFLEELLDLLQRDDAILPEMKLEDIEEWDSMARLSFMSFLDADFGVNISNDQLVACETVLDLIAFAKDKLL
ncbi:MAG: acyl carrier protein [Alphaproteobacteria bacterium]|nr:MAG: acyl carrier protein [Alphaproteobacteria bacterium]